MSSSKKSNFSGTYKFKSKESLDTLLQMIEYQLRSEFIPPFSVKYARNCFTINTSMTISMEMKDNEYIFRYEFPTYYARGWKLCEEILADIRLHYELKKKESKEKK
nr:hypothetical transcript [Hymenolepis microstoma]